MLILVKTVKSVLMFSSNRLFVFLSFLKFCIMHKIIPRTLRPYVPYI